MYKNWKISHANPQLQAKLSDSLHIHPIIAQLLINRKCKTVEDAREFLSSDIENLHDPFLFKDMDRAVKRIKEASRKKERVLVFGDYDVDGVTSSVLLNRVLTQLGIDVVHHIPHRMREGYGLNHEIGDFAFQNKVTLIIAVDCGITAVKEVRELKKQGFDVMIIDHHEPPQKDLPDAVAIVNPKQKDCPYPFKYLASVGLVAKLTQALIGKLDKDILDLVAIGTIADIVPLRGENRIFVKAGIPNIHKTKNKGLLALMDVAKIKGKKISPQYIGFIIGPRINATGRMDSALKSLDLFLSKDIDEAYNLARILEKHNTQRQKMQRDIVQEALEIVDQQINFKNEKVIVLHKEGWHKGVLGIVASKITDRYYRPTVVISTEGGVGTASARSIDGFHLYDALSDCAKHLEEFGGHQGAAGLTIKEKNIDAFRALINEIADRTMESKRLVPTIHIDCEIPISSIDMKLADIIDSMEPYGEGNPAPVFCSRGIEVKSRPALLGRDTIKFWVNDGESTISAVGFGMAKYKDMVTPKAKLDLAYQIIVDDWKKAPTAQLRLKDIRLSE